MVRSLAAKVARPAIVVSLVLVMAMPAGTAEPRTAVAVFESFSGHTSVGFAEASGRSVPCGEARSEALVHVATDRATAFHALAYDPVTGTVLDEQALTVTGPGQAVVVLSGPFPTTALLYIVAESAGRASLAAGLLDPNCFGALTTWFTSQQGAARSASPGGAALPPAGSPQGATLLPACSLAPSVCAAIGGAGAADDCEYSATTAAQTSACVHVTGTAFSEARTKTNVPVVHQYQYFLAADGDSESGSMTGVLIGAESLHALDCDGGDSANMGAEIYDFTIVNGYVDGASMFKTVTCPG